MGFFSKSKCSTCFTCNCCCASENVTVSTRKYTYTEENNCDNRYDANVEFSSIPTEQIILKGEGETPNIFYNQIDTEFYARNILESVPLVSYANGPFFKKMGEPSETSKFSLPTISYVADPVYLRRTKICRSENKDGCVSCDCFCPRIK